MKTISVINNRILIYKKQLSIFCSLMLWNVASFAQRSEAANEQGGGRAEFNYDSANSPWYTQPWIWAIVAAVLILVIAYASKGSLKKNMESDSEAGTTHN